jgi:transposase
MDIRPIFFQSCKTEQHVRHKVWIPNAIIVMDWSIFLYYNITGVVMRKSIGVDVAKESLEIAIFDGKNFENISYQGNNQNIFRKLIKDTKPDSDTLFLMEPTGNYHLRLAGFLHSKGCNVAFAHPFKVKNYRNMKFIRSKTDPVDARVIAEYGFHEKTIPYTPKNKNYIRINEKMKAIDNLIQSKTALNNKIESLMVADLDKDTIKAIKQVVAEIDRQKSKLEEQADAIAQMYFKEEVELIKSIPGIGQKCCNAILSHFNGFENFQSARAAACYVGLTPTEYTSGTSVHKKSRISKCGSAYVRNKLYMAALNASRYNKQCKELYERLCKRLKSKRQALVAVAHKLLRQAFAVVKYKSPYKADYQDERFQKNVV